MLTDEQIEAIAQKYLRPIGDHFVYEYGIGEGELLDFAREVEDFVLKNRTSTE